MRLPSCGGLETRGEIRGIREGIFRRFSANGSDRRGTATFWKTGERENLPNKESKNETPHDVPRSQETAGPAMSRCTATPRKKIIA